MKLTFLKPLHKGFMLIELMIVIAIIAIRNDRHSVLSKLYQKSGYLRIVTSFCTL